MASYVGLATGGGAAEGLETLYARMREEERLALQQRQQEEVERRNREQAEYQRMQQDMMRPYYEGLGAQAQAGARENEAQAGVQEARLRLIDELGGGGPPASPGMQLGGEPDLSGRAPAVASPRGTGGVGITDTPQTRVRLQVAGIPPNTIFPGAEGAANITPEEAFLNQFATEHGKQNYRQLNTIEFTRAKERWAAAGRDPLGIERFQLMKDRFEHTKEMDDWRKQQAEERQSLAQQRFMVSLGPNIGAMAAREYSDRIMREIKQDDPPSKYDTIRDEILSKYQEIAQRRGEAAGMKPLPSHGATPTTAAPAPVKRQRYDMNGNPIG